MVSYHNTLPFIEGFKLMNEKKFNLFFDTPSMCSKNFIEGKCDIALMPIGSLLHIENYNLITDYCIGCDGAVRTVTVLSNDSITELDEIYLDGDSKTSSILVQIIFKELLKKKIVFTSDFNHEFLPGKNKGILAIGDKVFDHENDFKYSYDLGLAWKKLTGLPFVFAVFVSKDDLDSETSKSLNDALKKGIDSIHTLDLSRIEIKDIKTYFLENISYRFDKQKFIAMKQFFEYAHNLI